MAECNGRAVISINECAYVAGVSRRTVYNWINEGKIQFVLTPSGTRRIFLDSIWHDREDEAKPSPISHSLGAEAGR